ncbi:hypothetical protein A5676_13010 [Mycobacterium malmoense]|uniref:hypothetical protein n=1 Tax=Mycobacterium malmoense TaxID=1780 RepID=UPI00080B2E41|nr:hypothetical protein [Mycobacterium malmoense]OCB39598.1 hypothetical protein A5676_13010 [Mycobacterium malmoense]
MPLRMLVNVAAIVWSAALIVALLVGLPALLTAQGVNINFALIISALSAAGSFTAAAIAVWIATTDRRQRKRERDAANEAQAKLVILDITYSMGRVGWDAPEYSVGCVNHGSTPILDVKLESAHMRAFPQAVPTLSKSEWAVLRPTSQYSASFATRWVDENGQPFPMDKKLHHVNAVDIEAAVTFFDVHGNQWRRSNTGTLTLLRKGGSGDG